MKGKIRTLENLVLSMIVVLVGFYIFYNVSGSKNNYEKKERSTPNYLAVNESNSEIQEVKKIKDTPNDSIEELKNEELKEKKGEDKKKVEPTVYDGKTLNELAITLNKSLNSTITDKGYLIASYSLEKGVDPYMATAIILHETGCKYGCSSLVVNCNNVGGQKGSGCGSYSYFNSLDEGIKAFIDNLDKNYVSLGLTTPEQINPKYAEDQGWSSKVNRYIEEIKAR